jgi:hypothetical protein
MDIVHWTSRLNHAILPLQILDQQKKEKQGQDEHGTLPRSLEDTEDTGVELGLHSRRRGAKTDQGD